MRRLFSSHHLGEDKIWEILIYIFLIYCLLRYLSEEQNPTCAWCGVEFLWSACNSSSLPNLHPHAFPQLEQGPFPQATVFKSPPPTHGVLMAMLWLLPLLWSSPQAVGAFWSRVWSIFMPCSPTLLNMCCRLPSHVLLFVFFFFSVETEAQLPLSGGVTVEPSGTLQNKLWQAHGSPDLMSQRLHLWFLLPASPWRPITRCLTELVSGLHWSEAAMRYLVWGITTAMMPVLPVAGQQCRLTDLCD